MKKIIPISFISLVLLTTACSRSDIPFIKNIVNNNDNGQATEIELHNNQAGIEDNTNSSTSDKKNTNQLILNEIFFNQIQEVNGEKIIQNPENHLVLVNKQFGLPETYLPNDLIRPNVNFSFGDAKVEKSLMRKEAAVALEKMFNAAKDAKIEIFAVSGYRSYVYQDSLFEAEVKKVGFDKAVEAVANPGKSEHQTGLAMDISSRGEGLRLTESFGESKEGKWLAENAHRFGYILRYPKGKENITGYQYESWHFRYVGVEAATIIYKNKWTLEEYFQIVKKM